MAFCVASCSYCPSIHGWARGVRGEENLSEASCHVWTEPTLPEGQRIRFNTRLFPLWYDRLESITSQKVDWVIDGNFFDTDAEAIRWGLSHCLVDRMIVILREGVDYYQFFGFLRNLDISEVPIVIASELDDLETLQWYENCKQWFPDVAYQFSETSLASAIPGRESIALGREAFVERYAGESKNRRALLDSLRWPPLNWLLALGLWGIDLIFMMILPLVRSAHFTLTLPSLVRSIPLAISAAPGRARTGVINWSVVAYWKILWPLSYVLRKPYYFLKYQIQRRRLKR